MKRIRLFAVGAVVVATILGFWSARHVKHRRIASALLAFHHEWATNDYHPPRTPLPKILLDQGRHHSDGAGVKGALVEYEYQKNGVEWLRGFQILRADTNTTTWTLYEFGAPMDTNLSRMAWRHTLITVKGEP